MTEHMVRADLPKSVLKQLEELYYRVQSETSYRRFMERHVTRELLSRLTSEELACRRGSNLVDLWIRAHGCTTARAVIDVARLLNFVSDADARRLLREAEEFSDDPEEALNLALRTAELVVTEHPRNVYWKGEAIAIDWNRKSSLWNYFVILCERTKQGRPVDAADFGERVKPDYHVKLKSTLTRTSGFPIDLAILIEAVSGGVQTLKLAPQSIQILTMLRD